MGLTLDDITGNYAPDEGAEFEVRGASGEVIRDEEGKAAVIRVAGVDSTVYRETRAVLAQRRDRYLQDRRAKKLTPDEEDEQAVEMAARCTLSWENLDVPFSLDKARELYRAAPWIRDDAIIRIHQREACLRE